MYLPAISENTGAISDNPSERVSSVECSGLPHSPIEENPKKEKTFIFTWGQVDSAETLLSLSNQIFTSHYNLCQWC